MVGFLEKQVPLVMRDVFPEIDETGEWSSELIRNYVKNREVDIRDSERQPDSKLQRMDLYSYLDQVDSLHTKSVIYSPLDDVLPELHQIWRAPRFLPRTPLTETIHHPSVWIGNQNSESDFRFCTQNESVIGCMRGVFEVTLYSPEDSIYLYQRGLFDSRFNWSRLDRSHKFQNATPFQAKLTSGDAIYIPVGWWFTCQTVNSGVRVRSSWQTLNRPALWSKSGIGSQLWKNCDK